MRQLRCPHSRDEARRFAPARFEERYETALLLKSKQAGRPVKAEASAPPPANVVNLMNALRRSIEAEKLARAPSVPERRKPAAGKADRRARPARATARDTEGRSVPDWFEFFPICVA
jgi:DNA end-binding protein Ku